MNSEQPTEDAFRLDRFVRAQDDGGQYQQALSELRAGRKRGHWIWFVLPQIAGLGLSSMSQRYAISGLAEARAYVAHPVLGPRLLDCAQALLGLPVDDAVAVLGSIDAVKLRSSMTLFARADPTEPVFRAVLDKYFDGTQDPPTVQLL